MNVALVVPGEAELWSHPRFLRPEILLVEGFAELGHEATIVCDARNTLPSHLPAVAVEYSALADAAFWRREQFDLVIVMTWLSAYADVLSAASRAGAFAVSRADSDGMVGVRAHPGSTLRHAYYSVPWVVPRLRNTWFWAKKLAYLYREHDQLVVANVERANATTVETDVARHEFIRFLERSGAGQLATKIHVAPYSPLERRFLTPSVRSNDKERLLYAVGRWDDPQKDSGLLASVLRRYLDTDTGARAVVAGKGGEAWLDDVKSPRREYVGELDQDALVDLATKARICLVTSRWESFHVGAHEAAAMGATVVGTPIPAMLSLTRGGRYGSVARSHRAHSLTTELTAEMRRWDLGLRDPVGISAYWRERLSPRAVASRFAELVGR